MMAHWRVESISFNTTLSLKSLDGQSFEGAEESSDLISDIPWLQISSNRFRSKIVAGQENAAAC